MEQKEFYLMINMLKTAIKQDKEFTMDESRKFNDLFENIMNNKIKSQSKV